MAKTLLLTGWGLPVYSVAAALAYKSPKIATHANIEAVSQRYLPKVLREKGTQYGLIYILGVGLGSAPAETAEAVQSLRQNDIQVIWISDRAIPQEIAPFFQNRDGSCCFSEVVCGQEGEGNLRLIDAVGKVFGCPKEEVRSLRRYASLHPNTAPDWKEYRQLFAAADWKHKTYREYESYPAAIRLLANGVSAKAWPKEMRDVIDLYAKWGKRQLQGESAQIKEVKRLIERAARHDDAEARVFITGPSGTGKETVAQQIHMLSSRKDHPFMSFNCACTTRGLFESKLFGHTANAYTGAQKEEVGLFALAAHGTLFLDEIAELDSELQGYLLRVLQDGEYQKLGSNIIEKVDDVRVITATNKDLVRLVKEGKFREDLYWRLRVVTITMCGLNERKEDIAPIADNLWYRETNEHLTFAQLKALEGYSYPGNARELENMLTKAHTLEITDFDQLVAEQIREHHGLYDSGEGGVAEGKALEPKPSQPVAEGVESPVDAEDQIETLEVVRRRYAQSVFKRLRAKGHSQKYIARLLGVSENSLKKYVKV